VLYLAPEVLFVDVNVNLGDVDDRCKMSAGEVVPIPTFCEVSIVTAVVPLLDASCNTPEVSPLMFRAVPLVVPAETIEAIS
jgi:hypothetical protein